MAVSAKWYGNGPKRMALGELLWKAAAGSVVKVALCTVTYTPNQDTHEFFSHITNELAGGNGYTAGGATLTKIDASYDSASNETRLDANDVVWSASSLTARYAIIYISTGTASTSALLGWVDFGQDYVSVSGDFTITWDAAGLLKITAA
jgi:hypothetical protein